jgi:nicotinamidase/pyrazinamidase
MARALLIVDVQPTFCEDGELPVPGGNETAFRVAEFLLAHRDDYQLTITSQDWHIDPPDHFSDDPDFIDSWPPHGLAGSPNADLHPALVAALGEDGADVTIKKGQHAAAYSAFEGTDPAGAPLRDLLSGAAVDRLDICGIAETHCVRSSALDALKLGLEVRIFGDLTVPVTEDLGRAARAELSAAGAILTTSS